MSKLNWRTMPHAELSLLLKQAVMDAARAVGSATVYQLTVEGREMLAVSLPDGQALVVEASAPPPRLNRRKSPVHEPPPH